MRAWAPIPGNRTRRMLGLTAIRGDMGASILAPVNTLFRESFLQSSSTVPRKNPLDRREREICQRLRAFRTDLGLSCVEFARRAGIDSSALVRHEHFRVPVRYGLVRTLVETFGLNEIWLAKGTGRSHGPHFLPEGFRSKLPSTLPFSEAFDRHISPAIVDEDDRGVFSAAAILRGEVPDWEKIRSNIYVERTLARLSEELTTGLPAKDRARCAAALLEAYSKWRRQNGK
jgi:hypothetical protein